MLHLRPSASSARASTRRSDGSAGAVHCIHGDRAQGTIPVVGSGLFVVGRCHQRSSVMELPRAVHVFILLRRPRAPLSSSCRGGNRLSRATMARVMCDQPTNVFGTLNMGSDMGNIF